MSLQAAGRNVNIDRLDSCQETHLGLCATCCCTLTIWLVLLPFFDIVGMNWIAGWRGKSGLGVSGDETSISDCGKAISLVYSTPKQAWARMDADLDDVASRDEFEDFASEVNGKLEEKGHEKMEVLQCFAAFDTSENGELEEEEFYKNAGEEYHWSWSISAAEFRKRVAKQFGSMAAACDTEFDQDKNGQVTLAEFSNVTARLDPPLDENDVWRLFEHIDTDANQVLSQKECHFRTSEVKQRLSYAYGSVKAGCEKIDKDHDLKVSKAEFIEGVSVLTPPINEDDAKQLFPHMDKNHSGEIDLVGECYVDPAEFKKRVEASGKTLQETFKRMDEDKNGTLSREEFANGGPAANISTWDMEDVMKDMDKNEDQTIDQAEFLGKAFGVASTTPPEESTTTEATTAPSEESTTAEATTAAPKKSTTTAATTAPSEESTIAEATTAAPKKSTTTEATTAQSEASTTEEATTAAPKESTTSKAPTATKASPTTTTAVPTTAAPAMTTAEPTTPATTTAPPRMAATPSDSLEGGKALSDEEMADYTRVPAMVSARTKVYFTADVPKGSYKWLADDVIHGKLKTCFKKSVEEYMGGEINIQTMSTDAQSTELPDVAQKIFTIVWESDRSRAGGFQMKLKDEGQQLQDAIVAGIKEIMPWVEKDNIDIGTWDKFSCMYYGERAEHMPRGVLIKQRSGNGGPHKDIGAPPYTV